MSLENRFEQQMHRPTEILDNTPGFNKYFEDKEKKYDARKQNMRLIIGAAGVGKTLFAAQYQIRLETSKAIAQKIASTDSYGPDGRLLHHGKEHLIVSYSLDTFLMEFKRGRVGAEGALLDEEYVLGSANMARKIYEDKTDFALRSPQYAVDSIIIVPAVGSRGWLVMNVLDMQNLEIVALYAKRRVKDNAKIIRVALWQGKKEFLDALEKCGVTIDIDLTDEVFSEFQLSMGNSESVDIHEGIVNQSMLGNKKELVERGAPNFDSEDLISDQNKRAEVERNYFDYLIGEICGVPKNKYLVAENVFLEKTNMYLSRLVKTH